jgi:hypothetical protein
VWRIKAPHEHKFFLWLAIQDRCWTSERRHRHGLADSNDCALCGQSAETMDHLLIGCVFSREFWYRFLHCFDWQALTPPQQVTFLDWWMRSRRWIGRARRSAFDSMVALVARMLWFVRNVSPSVETPHVLCGASSLTPCGGSVVRLDKAGR